MIKLINQKLNKISRPAILVILTVILYIGLFSLISGWKYFNFGYNAMDLAIINQVFYNSSLGNWLASSIHPPSYLGDHFTPIILILLPFYWLFKHPITLLILQTAALGASSWPIFLIAKKILNKNWAALIAGAWLINPLVGNINLFEFHFLPFAVLGIFWAFYFYQNKKFIPFLLTIILTLLVQEDVALVIFMFGIIAVFEKNKFLTRPERLKWIITPMILAGIYFIAALKIISLFSTIGQYKFLVYYSWLGNSWLNLAINSLIHPLKVLAHLTTLGNLELILGLLMPFVFLPLLKPKYLILSAGIFCQLILGAAGGSAIILETHYSALLLPGLLISAIYALEKIISPINQKCKIINLINKDKKLSLLIFLTSLLYCAIAMGPVIGIINKFNNAGIIWPETNIKNNLLKQIPTQAAVATTYEFLPALSSQKNLYSFNYVFLGKQQFVKNNYALPDNTEYLLINYDDLITYQLQYAKNPIYNPAWLQAQTDWPARLNDFGLIDIKGTLALYQKNQPNRIELIKILDAKPKINNPENVAINDKLKFVGSSTSGESYQLFWQGNLNQPLQFQLIVEQQGKTFYQKVYPLAYYLLSAETTRLTSKQDEFFQTNYWFDFNKKIPAGEYNLKLQIIEIESGGIMVDSIRSTQNMIDKYKTIGPEILLDKIVI